jgi:hypothetical protein
VDKMLGAWRLTNVICRGVLIFRKALLQLYVHLVCAHREACLIGIQASSQATSPTDAPIHVPPKVCHPGALCMVCLGALMLRACNPQTDHSLPANLDLSLTQLS